MVNDSPTFVNKVLVEQSHPFVYMTVAVFMLQGAVLGQSQHSLQCLNESLSNPLKKCSDF